MENLEVRNKYGKLEITNSNLYDGNFHVQTPDRDGYFVFKAGPSSSSIGPHNSTHKWIFSRHGVRYLLKSGGLNLDTLVEGKCYVAFMRLYDDGAFRIETNWIIEL